tara:strand:- start:21 stop:248 length:228 start_codon:yes stop_codon:yes gene_type:complete
MVRKGVIEGKIVTGSKGTPSGVRHRVRTRTTGGGYTDRLPGFPKVRLRDINKHLVDYEVLANGDAKILKVHGKRR